MPFCSTVTHIKRVSFLDVGFDRLTFGEVLEQLARPSDRLRYIVTPNVDHVVRLHSNRDLLPIYEEADLCVCDSRILRSLARLADIDLPVVAGSDLTATVLQHVIRPGDRIAVVGATAGVLTSLRDLFPDVTFIHHQAPMGLAANPRARRAAAEFIVGAAARFTFVAVGSPQGEMIANEAAALEGAQGTVLCTGAAIEFVTGDQKRAPPWIRKLGFEWAHRLVQDPRRLWRRYLVDGLGVFPIFARWSLRANQLNTLGAAIAIMLCTIGLYSSAAANRSTPGSGVASAEDSSIDSAQVGLPAPDLLRPLSAGAAAEANAKRVFVDRADAAAAEFVVVGDTASRERAALCLAQAVYYEAAGEPEEGMRAVAQIVLNRVRHPAYPPSVCGVVYQGSRRSTGCQFSFTCDGSLKRPASGRAWQQAKEIASSALAGGVFARLGHATHYHADYVLPYWADSLDKTMRIGTHLFYRFRGGLGRKSTFAQRYSAIETLPAMEVEPAAEEAPAEKLLAQLGESDETVAGEGHGAKKEQLRLLADATAGTLIVPGASSSTRWGASRERTCSKGEQQLRPLKPNEFQRTASTDC